VRRAILGALAALLVLSGCATAPVVVSPIAPSIATAQTEEVELVATATTAKDQAEDLSTTIDALPAVPEPVKAQARALASITAKQVELLDTHTATLATAQGEAQAATVTMAKTSAAATKSEIKAAKSSGWIVGLGAALVGLLLLIAGYVVGKIRGIFK
jgi:cobalamin biosynthesis Mg chelatase CobN